MSLIKSSIFRSNQLNRKSSNGVSLIEVLVALFTLTVGLLGLASLQSKTIQFNQSAYLRTQATLLSNDIVERYRANKRDTTSTFFQSEVTTWENLVAQRLPSGSGTVSELDDVVSVTITWADRDNSQSTFELEANL